MRYGYLIFNYSEDGPESVFFTDRRENVITEFSTQRAICRKSVDMEEAMISLEKAMVNNDEKLFEMGNINLLSGWGGATLRCVVIE